MVVVDAMLFSEDDSIFYEETSDKFKTSTKCVAQVGLVDEESGEYCTLEVNLAYTFANHQYEGDSHSIRYRKPSLREHYGTILEASYNYSSPYVLLSEQHVRDVNNWLVKEAINFL